MSRINGGQEFEDLFLKDCELLAKMKNFDIYLKKLGSGKIGFVVDAERNFYALPIDDKNKCSEIIEATDRYNKRESQKDMDFLESKVAKLLNIK